MKKNIVAAIAVFLFATGALFSLDVDKTELGTVKAGSVEFLNYTGPHDFIDTREEIINIGVAMGRPIKSGGSSGSYNNAYFVSHMPGLSGELIGADVITLSARARVDHVRNLRFIIAGFIMTVYDYSFDESFLLAEFITIYNAVYRGNMQKFSSRYTNDVVSGLEQAKAGLSTRYNEWPGASQIIIPLTDKAGQGDFGSLSSKELTDEGVIEEMRAREDMGVDSRKDMADLKDKELQEKESEFLEDKQELASEREDLSARRQETEKAAGDIADKQEALDSESKALEDRDAELAQSEENLQDLPPGQARDQEQQRIDDQQAANDQRRQEIDQEQRQLDEEKQQTADRQTAEAQEASALDDREEQISQREEDINREREDLQQERADISADEQRLVDQGLRQSQPEYVLFMKVDENNPSKTGQLLLIDKDSGVIDRSSGISTLRNRIYQIIDNSIVCISGSASSAKLVLFDMESLSITRESDVNVYSNSVLVLSGNNLYAAVRQNTGWSIGIFDKELNLKMVSDKNIDPYTPIIIADSKIFAQSADGQIMVLTDDNFTRVN